MAEGRVAVALVHWPVLNRLGESSATAITTTDIHDFARSCAMFDVAPVYMVHPSSAMRQMVGEIAGYWQQGSGQQRNPGRGEVLESVRAVATLDELAADPDVRLWYTSAKPPVVECAPIAALGQQPGVDLIVFGTGWGLDFARLPEPHGWLSPIEGVGRVRHLSVRAALAIYLDRLRQPRQSQASGEPFAVRHAPGPILEA